MKTAQIEKVKISNNKGLTWNEQEIDIKQTNPNETTLKVGDWIERNNIKYEIKQLNGTNEEYENNPVLKRLDKYKGMLYASAIIEYIVVNRSFNSYEEAVKYCNECDLDIELNIITK